MQGKNSLKSFSPDNDSVIKIKKSYLWSNSNSHETDSFEVKKTPDFQKRDMKSFRMYIDSEEEKKSKFQEEELLPDRIEGYYIHDYNILKIDEILKKKFAQDKKKIIGLNDKLEIEMLKIQGRQNLIERKTSRKKISDYESEINKYTNNETEKEYIERSQNLLNKYKELGPINTVVSFENNNKEIVTSPENEEKQNIRHRIIFDYLEIARKYIPIDLIRHLPNSTCCTGCGVDTSEMEVVEDESGSTICPNCGLEKINIVKSAFYADGSRVNNSRNNYEDRANFEKVLMRYQGKQITKPGRELYMKLDEYFISRGLPSSKQYNALPLLSDGTKKETSKDMMFEALSNIGCSGYYDDINLICSVFFGWSLPDVTHLEEDIMKDYDDFQAVYDQLPDREGRKSSLNSQWKLYILLKRRNWSCRSKDFKIPNTPSILEYHKIKTKQIYEILGWDCPF